MGSGTFIQEMSLPQFEHLSASASFLVPQYGQNLWGTLVLRYSCSASLESLGPSSSGITSPDFSFSLQQTRRPECAGETPASSASSHLNPHAMDLSVAVGDHHVPLDHLAVDQDALHALADPLGLVYLYLVDRASEPAPGGDGLPLGGKAGVHLKAVVSRPDAEDVRPEDVPLPGRPAGEPRVRALAEVLGLRA